LNFAEWLTVMRSQLQGQWDTIDFGANDEHDDGAALQGLLRAKLVRTRAT
jgi:hypothetical protein